jgi:hypothetical protein
MNEAGLIAAAAATGAAATAITGLVAAVAYGGQYFYEYVMWDNEAQETEFRRQFLAHVTQNQQLFVNLTSANWSIQVEQ